MADKECYLRLIVLVYPKCSWVNKNKPTSSYKDIHKNIQIY